MAYASLSGRARTNVRNPRAHAICDRCGFRYNHFQLSWQYDWAGASVQNKRILVCSRCLDEMQDQLRSIVVPADPIPIQQPRIQDFVTAETNYRVTQDGSTRTTQDGSNRVTQQTGAAPGSLNNTPGTDPNAPGNTSPGLPYNNTTVPKSS